MTMMGKRARRMSGTDDGPAYEEVPVAPGEPTQTGYLDAEPVPQGDEVGDGDDYPTAHVVDLEADGTLALCGEELDETGRGGELLEDRILAYTCTECQEAMTARYNALSDALLAAQLRLRVIQSAVIGHRGGGLDTAWARRVRETAADATDAMLEQSSSGPRQ